MVWIYGAVTLGFAMMTFRAVQVALRHKRRGWSLLERPGETED
jgi:TRAP-type C4-dicarboxylate transport system permease small subunit